MSRSTLSTNRIWSRSGRLFLLTALALAVLASAPASAEQRKFVVMPAWPRKTVEETGITPNQPNPNDIYAAYFDDFRDDVDSFAEYWAEVSYGQVAVSGDVYNWVEIPWPILPAGIDMGAYGPLYVIQSTDLDGNDELNQFDGESFDQSEQEVLIDYNGAVDGTGWEGNGPGLFATDNNPTVGLVDFDTNGNPVWTPGERFRDLNGNGRYDALLEPTVDGYGECDENDLDGDGDVLDLLKDGVIDTDEFCDWDGDNEWDFPEPFEDFLRIYNPFAPEGQRWIRLDPARTTRIRLVWTSLAVASGPRRISATTTRATWVRLAPHCWTTKIDPDSSDASATVSTTAPIPGLSPAIPRCSRRPAITIGCATHSPMSRALGETTGWSENILMPTRPACRAGGPTTGAMRTLRQA